MNIQELHNLLEKLVSLPKETEWLEFKSNNADPQEIRKAGCTIYKLSGKDKQQERTR